jgi:uncharacterized protein
MSTNPSGSNSSGNLNEPQIPSLNVSKILRGDGDVSGKGSLERLELIKPGIDGAEPEIIEIPLVGAAQWRASISSVGPDEFWLSGRIRGTALFECARCLEPTHVPVEAKLEGLLRYDPKVKQAHIEIDDEDQDVLLFSDPTIDLTPFLSEAFNIELPLSALHAPDCKGLCVECGTNLNQLEAGTCAANKTDCPQFKPVKFEPDHPLAGLGNLRDLLED